MTRRYSFRSTLRATDANHAAIVRAARDCGYHVVDTHMIGRGVPDCVVIRPSDQRAWLVEIKTETGELTEAEVAYALRSRTLVHVIRSVDEILKLIGAIT